jgi:hypothetical protein
MGEQDLAIAADPRAAIAAAVARIEAAAAALRFADEAEEEEARAYIARGVRIIRYHVRKVLPPGA